MPSSSGKTEKLRLSKRSFSRSASSCRLPSLKPRTMRSSWAAVQPRARSKRSASFSGVATRESARTFENDSSPRLMEAPISGSFTRALAARTLSRQAPRSNPVRNASQWAQDRWPPTSQPRRRSYSATRVRNRCSPAWRWAARNTISSSIFSRASRVSASLKGTGPGAEEDAGEAYTCAVSWTRSATGARAANWTIDCHLRCRSRGLGTHTEYTPKITTDSQRFRPFRAPDHARSRQITTDVQPTNSAPAMARSPFSASRRPPASRPGCRLPYAGRCWRGSHCRDPAPCEL